MTDTNELATTVENLSDRLDAVEEENERLRSEVEETRADLAAERKRRVEVEDELAEVRSDLQETRADIEEARNHFARNIAQNAGRINALEESETEETGSQIPEDATPIEQIAALPQHIAEEQFDNPSHRNTFRARTLLRSWSKVSENTPRGRLIGNGDLCRILTTVEEKPVESKTGTRVMARIAELSRGKFSHVPPEESNRGEHLLVQEPDAELHAPTSFGRGGDHAVTE